MDWSHSTPTRIPFGHFEVTLVGSWESCSLLLTLAWGAETRRPSRRGRSLYSPCLLLAGPNPGHIPAWARPDPSRREPQTQNTVWTASSWLLGHSSEQNSGWRRLKGSGRCCCQCDGRLQDFVKQADEPSQTEAPNAAQLCNWDGNGPMRGDSLCLTFWEACSRRLCVGGEKKHYK